MYQQITSGVISLGLLSTLATPTIAQSVSVAPQISNSTATNQGVAEDRSSLATNILVTEDTLENLAVKNTLTFAHFNDSEELPNLSEPNEISQRSRRYRSKYKYSAGLDWINFGWVKDKNGQISSILGFNTALGIGYRKYFKPVQEGKFNFNFTVGTIFLINPFVAVGADYQ
jgi:hypothetical protein